jgi:ribonuclease Y
MIPQIIITALIFLLLGGAAAWFAFNVQTKSKKNHILEEAEKEAEAIKKDKLLEVKEKFISLKSDLDRETNERNAKLQSQEVKAKQQEIQLAQKQEELSRKNNEVDAIRDNLHNQLEIIEQKKSELDKVHRMEIERLEALSGLSAEEVKERLAQSLKDEAKTSAAAYINEVVEEAKMTANKEAKKIVVQSIQRVATETAIENAISVFQIDSDELKGRIIGREGRNIRALEAATGIEIIVDDTPEAIILS